MMRRTLLIGLIAAVALIICVGCAHSSTPTSQQPKVDPRQAEIDAAVERGLDWLIANQCEDGLWYQAGDYVIPTASIAGLALLHRAAYADNPEKYMKAAQKTATSVMSRLDSRTGRIRLFSHPGSYTHDYVYAYDQALGLLFLLQAWKAGIDFREEKYITEYKFAKAIKFIQSRQSHTGCWHENYISGIYNDSPTTLSLCALITARDAGMEIDEDALKDALTFTDTYAHTAHYLERKASGVAAFLVCGMYDTPQRQKTVKEFAAIYAKKSGGDPAPIKYQIMYELFASMACYYLGGEQWDTYYRAAVERYLPRQQASGTWPGVLVRHRLECWEAYTTAVACLILQMPHRALPMYKDIDSTDIRKKLGLED